MLCAGDRQACIRACSMLLLLQAACSAKVRRTSVGTHPHKRPRFTHTRQGGARAMPAAAFLLSLPGQLLSSSLFPVADCVCEAASCFPPLSCGTSTLSLKLSFSSAEFFLFLPRRLPHLYALDWLHTSMFSNRQ